MAKKVLRSQLPFLFAMAKPMTDKVTKQPLLKEDGTPRTITNFYVMLASGRYVQVRPTVFTNKDGTKDTRDLQRLLDNVPVITSVEDIQYDND